MAASASPATAPPAEITLFGATGYTGRQIARTLAREKLSFRIAGRSAERLSALSNELPNHPSWIVADAARASSLVPLFKDTRLLINCAGPFTDMGERVISQAALTGTHYLDITNELGYVFRARGYHQLAQRNGAALVPACGFEVALADCLAHKLGKELSPSPSNPLDLLDVIYELNGISSRGTRRSSVRTLATSWITYRDGQWTGQIPGGRTRRFLLPSTNGTVRDRRAFSIPSCESITVPGHLPVRRVDVWMTTVPSARFWAPLAIPLLARLSRSILRGLILRLADTAGVDSDAPPQAKGSAPFTVLTRATRGNAGRGLALSGNDPYALTAEIITYFAREMTQPEYARRGMLAPAQAVNPDNLIDYAQDKWDCSLRTVQG